MLENYIIIKRKETTSVCFNLVVVKACVYIYIYIFYYFSFCPLSTLLPSFLGRRLGRRLWNVFMNHESGERKWVSQHSNMFRVGREQKTQVFLRSFFIFYPMPMLASLIQQNFNYTLHVCWDCLGLIQINNIYKLTTLQMILKYIWNSCWWWSRILWFLNF